MSKRMLIDASHPEETRVVILSGNRVEEFDFESASRKPLKGNIFLARVTRVEPSLQAAFIEYGGNRHGFLAFSEIHPDYYQIPVADRQALLAAQRADERRRDFEDDAVAEGRPVPPPSEGEPDPMPTHAASENGEQAMGFEAFEAAIEPAEEAGDAPLDNPTAPQSLQEPDAAEPAEAPVTALADEGSEPAALEAEAATDDAEAIAEDDAGAAPEGEARGEIEEIAAEPIETEVISSGEDDAQDEAEARRPSQRMMRNYKIQEVIKKRQILLVQVVKEERGNKGAALTTYLSLAGRYCVLMPNSGRGGGISRKITNSTDRRRLKDAAESLDVPEGMGLIVRTAGASRTKQEIQRDYEYLLRLWDSIRDLTLRSSAPALVYEEGNLIKRAIRDQFSREIEEIIVEGEEGFAEAHAFTKMIMPHQIEAVKKHDGRPPLFQKYKVESQLDSMFNPRVQLKSGGYLIINQTEALVAIDVNSGRSTREHNIEDTAHKTNLEAAEEVARQLRLRDLAGLIVIDFIDMEENRNDRAVERRLKECLRHDRARIQLGRISPFGLLEMSRQRLRPGMVEGSTVACPHCNGTGLIRSVESLALRALRNVEEEAHAGRIDGVTVRVPTEVAVYILNHKRSDVASMEERLAISIFVEARADMFGADCEVEVGAPNGFRSRRAMSSTAVSAETALAMMPEPPAYDSDEQDEIEPAGDGEGSIEEVGEARESAPRGDRPPRDRDDKGGRRRRGRGRDRERDGRKPRPAALAGDPMPVIPVEDAAEGVVGEAVSEPVEGAAAPARDSERDGGDRRRRRRGRRGGRRNGRPEGEFEAAAPANGEDSEPGEADEATQVAAEIGQAELDPPPPGEAAAAASAPRKDRSSATAAIARFFGFAPPKPAEPPPEPAHVPAPPKPAYSAPEAGAAGFMIEPEAVSPKPPAPKGDAPAAAPEMPPETFVAAHDPEPVAIQPAPLPETEAAMSEPEPAVSTAPATEVAAPTTPFVAEPVAADEPAPVAEEPKPEFRVPAEPEKAEIVVLGPAVTGPAKAGWWKKREA